MRSTAAMTMGACLALATAGCGGGGDRARQAAYAEVYEGACAAMVSAAQRFQTRAAEIGAAATRRPERAVAPLKVGADELLGAFARQFAVLARAEAPESLAEFQASVRRADPATQRGIRQARAAIGRIETVDGFRKLDAVLSGIRIGGTQKVPGELAGRAPSCRSFGAA